MKTSRNAKWGSRMSRNRCRVAWCRIRLQQISLRRRRPDVPKMCRSSIISTWTLQTSSPSTHFHIFQDLLIWNEVSEIQQKGLCERTHDRYVFLHVFSQIPRLVTGRVSELEEDCTRLCKLTQCRAYLATPLEDQREFRQLPHLPSLLLGINRLQLCFGTWELDLAKKCMIQLRQLG